MSIGIRGSAARGAFALRGIAVLVDGVPVTESDGRSRLDLIELAASRQVEVVRGPVSALYAGSSGGVVNVVSRSGRDSRGVSGRALRGAFGFLKYDGHAGGVFAGGRSSGFASASHRLRTRRRMDIGGHSDGSNARGQVSFDFVAGPGMRLAIEAHGSRLDLRLPGTLTQQEFDANPDAADSAFLTFHIRRADSRYRAGVRLEQTFSAGMATGYFFYGGRTLSLPSPFGGWTGISTARRVGGDFARTALPACRSVPPSGSTTISSSARINGGRTTASVAAGSTTDTSPFRTSAFTPRWGGQVSPPVGVTLGLRYDRVGYRFESYMPEATYPRQETSFDHLSPRLSALWSPDSATSVYASVGRGTEVPIIGELSAAPSIRIRDSLRPKSRWNYEVGAPRVIDGRVLLEGTVFYADVKGEFVPNPIDTFTAPVNASRSRNIGAELGVTARASHRLELGASYTFVDLRLRDYKALVFDSTGTPRTVDFGGKLLPAVPRHRVTGEVRFRPLAAMDLGMQFEWQSVVYVETGNADAGIWYYRTTSDAPVQEVPFRAVPARALVHLNAAWRLGPATLFGSVENLFGLRYAGTVEANQFFGRFYEAGPPASVSLGLRLTSRGPASGSALLR